jgi:manganese transport protein
LPVPLVALLVFVGRRDIMGSLVSGWVTMGVAAVATTVVLLLNLLLLLQLAGVDVPFLPAG